MNSKNRYDFNAEEREQDKGNYASPGRGRGQAPTKSEAQDAGFQKDEYEMSRMSQMAPMSSPKGSPRNSDKPPDPNSERMKREQSTAKCYPPHPRRRLEVCKSPSVWQSGKYVRDECGSGIVPHRFNLHAKRAKWCSTPLTSYQASHGELARQILCGEHIIQRTIEEAPPCNICEYVLPMCRGYYRKYDCEKPPCEEEYWSYKKRPRDKVEKYWEPCASAYQRIDVNNFAHHNVALGAHLKKKIKSCW